MFKKILTFIFDFVTIIVFFLKFKTSHLLTQPFSLIAIFSHISKLNYQKIIIFWKIFIIKHLHINICISYILNKNKLTYEWNRWLTVKKVYLNIFNIFKQSPDQDQLTATFTSARFFRIICYKNCTYLNTHNHVFGFVH